MKLKVRVYNKFKNEIEYSIEELFRYFNVQILFETSFRKETIITLENTSQIILSNYFFRDFNNLYSKKNIPNKLDNIDIDSIQVPLIYGTSKTVKKGKKLYVDADIISSTFYMLSRWEEYVIESKDEHNRFNHNHALAVKHNFIHFPIVDYYSLFVERIFKKLGVSIKRKARNFKITPTHDVDFLKKYQTAYDGTKEIIGDLVKRKDVLKAIKNFKSKLKSHLNSSLDPYNKFDLLMDISEKNNLVSEFYFMIGGKSLYDNNFKFSSNRVKELIKQIQERGHRVGIHPSYNSYINPSIFEQEVREFIQTTDIYQLVGRQHYLRFKFPETLRLWNKYCREDLSLGYAKQEGFRCGTCIEFSCFDIEKRKKLQLKERPLIFMESTFFNYKKKLTSEDIIASAKKLKHQVYKFNGEFIVLWHNSSLHTNEMVDTYNEIITQL